MLELFRFLRTLLFCICLLGQAGIGQTAPLLTNVDGRHTSSLSGQWHTIVDPYDTGSLDYHNQPLTNKNAFYKNYKPESKADLVEYDFDTSAQLQVPGDWNTQRDSLLLYEGTIWYERAFDYAKLDGKRLFVHFGAANYAASVYLNGKELGQHQGGFTPFDFEITGEVHPHNNILVVKVDNSRRADHVPAVNSDWWNYGGITRPVALVKVPETFIQDNFIQFEKGSIHRIAGWVQLNGPQLEQ